MLINIYWSNVSSATGQKLALKVNLLHRGLKVCLMVYDWTSLPLSACFDVTGKENGLFESDFLKHQHNYFVLIIKALNMCLFIWIYCII